MTLAAPGNGRSVPLGDAEFAGHVVTDAPDITVIVPARDEVADLSGCISALAEQDLDRRDFEVVVVDGRSSDGTADLAADLLAASGLEGRVLTNAQGTTPTSLNAGLADARGRIVCRVDARSVVPPHYLRVCRDRLDEDPHRAVVGGSQVAVDDQSGLVARSISRALANPLTTGLARYRRGAPSGPTDTVYLGAFRTRELRAVGGWDPRFRTNQDYELNRRMAAHGLVWFDAGLSVGYIPRSSIRDLARQYRRFGRWKAAIWLETEQRPTHRHALLIAAPPVAVALGAAGLRTRPRLTALAVAVALAVIDSGVGRPSRVAERAGGVAAALVSSACWWGGIVEQCSRAAGGQRLLDTPTTSEDGHAH